MWEGGQRSPVLHGVEGLLVGDVVHQDEAHGPAVIGGGDGAVPLLPGRVLGEHTVRGAQCRAMRCAQLWGSASTQLLPAHRPGAVLHAVHTAEVSSTAGKAGMQSTELSQHPAAASKLPAGHSVYNAGITKLLLSRWAPRTALLP